MLQPLVMERILPEDVQRDDLGTSLTSWVHTKSMYRLNEQSMCILQGCTPDMCSTGTNIPAHFEKSVVRVSKSLV